MTTTRADPIADTTTVTGVGGGEASHRWRCPVIMKTAPDYVAYTCGRCAAIGVVAVGEPLSKLRGWGTSGGRPTKCSQQHGKFRD
jgi:hypothetical protein